MISYTIKNISGSIGQIAIDDFILNQNETKIIYIKTPDVIAAEKAGLISVTQNGTDTDITGTDVVTALGYTPYDAANPNGYTSNSGTVTNFVFSSVNGFTGNVTNSNSTPTLSISLQDATSSVSGKLTSADWNIFNNKQDLLNSGINIKTINGMSILGSGNLVISGGGGGSGTVTEISINTANGFSGSVTNPNTTPALNLSTTVTGIIKGNGTALSAAVAGTDYLAPNGNGSALTGLTSSQISGGEATANKDASGGYAGLTLFKINFKNVANTFTSFFTNSNTAARTYTFQDRDGTIADNTDLAAKQDTLVSATNIKTINGNSILGSGDLSISGGSSSSVSKTATGSITAYTVVKYVSATNVSTASNADSDLYNVIGIAQSSVSNGATVSITPTGQEITNGSWAWTALQPVYLSTAGALTQTEPTSNYVLVIGVAVSTTVIKVNITTPVQLVA